jgi:CheY-like chemotaxis protein
MSDTPLPRSNKVLLVDGDVRTTQRLAELLRDDGFDVEVARDGATAIARLARAPLPDTLITELRIPLADGTAVARYARSQRPGLRVVVVTGYPNLLVREAFGNPPPLVMAKPLDYAQLLLELHEPITAHETSAASPPSRRS